MPFPSRRRRAPVAELRHTLDSVYARIDETIAELPAPPSTDRAPTNRPVNYSLQAAPATAPPVDRPAA